MSLPEPVIAMVDSALEFVYGLEPLVAPTVVLVPPIAREVVQQLSDMIGFDVPTLTYTLGMFLTYPLGMIMCVLPYGKIRHVFSFLLGAFLLQFTVGVQWIHQLITSLLAYAMFVLLPRKYSKLAVPIMVMIYITLGHLHRQYINYLGWDLDFTGCQMVLTQKLYMMAYNLYDGELIAKGKSDKAAKKCEKYALKELPDLIEFLGYCFCFSSALAGPANEFTTYRNACDGSLLVDTNGKPKGKKPSNFLPTLLPFLKCLMNLVIFVVVGGMFPLLDTVDPKVNTPILLSVDFLAKPWIYRYAYMWVGLFAVRQKYYYAWNSAEGANNIWYFGFDGFDAEGKSKGWTTASNIDMWKFETAPNVQQMSKEWNQKTSMWLAKYVYIRTDGNLAAVYGLSAFWHGFYPDYYMFFMSIPLMTFCERLGKKKISPYFSKEHWTPYGVVSMIATSFCVEYMVAGFICLAADRTWAVWKSHYFLGHILCVVFYAVVSQFPTPKKKEKTT